MKSEKLLQKFLVETETDTPIDVFNAAVDYELLSNSIDEAEQLAKDYIDTEKNKLRKIDNFID